MSSGICVGLYCARPTFIRMSVPPMANEETITPINEANLLPERRGADEVAGFQVLRSGAGDRRGDADDAADREREDAVGVGRPAEHEERWRRWPSAWQWSCR